MSNRLAATKVGLTQGGCSPDLEDMFVLFVFVMNFRFAVCRGCCLVYFQEDAILQLCSVFHGRLPEAQAVS